MTAERYSKAWRSLAQANIHQVPGVLVRLQLNMILFIQLELNHRVEGPFVFLLVRTNDDLDPGEAVIHRAAIAPGLAKGDGAISHQAILGASVRLFPLPDVSH